MKLSFLLIKNKINVILFLHNFYTSSQECWKVVSSLLLILFCLNLLILSTGCNLLFEMKPLWLHLLQVSLLPFSSLLCVSGDSSVRSLHAVFLIVLGSTLVSQQSFIYTTLIYNHIQTHNLRYLNGSMLMIQNFISLFQEATAEGTIQGQGIYGRQDKTKNLP